jgi:hypothetical protein
VDGQPAQAAPGRTMSVPERPAGAAEPFNEVLVSFLQGCGVGRLRALEIAAEVAPGMAGSPSKADVSDLLLSLVGRCVDDTHPITYVSVPVTTGRAYLEWQIRQGGGADDPARPAPEAPPEVVAANRRRAGEVVGRLRARVPGLVIDPSRLVHIDGWTQADYHAFWLRVIDKYAESIVFVDGWQYSVGCTIEFAEAIRLALRTLTEHFRPLDYTSGVRLIRTALREYAAARVNSVRLRRSLDAAERAVSAKAAAPRR